MKSKIEMAHEMALAIQGTNLIHDMELVSDMAWKYADAMQAEADKRLKADVGTADSSDLQPDWSQLDKMIHDDGLMLKEQARIKGANLDDYSFVKPYVPK